MNIAQDLGSLGYFIIAAFHGERVIFSSALFADLVIRIIHDHFNEGFSKDSKKLHFNVHQRDFGYCRKYFAANFSQKIRVIFEMDHKITKIKRTQAQKPGITR